MDLSDQITGNVPFAGASDSTGITGITETIIQSVVDGSSIVQQTFTQTVEAIPELVNTGEQVYQDTFTQTTQGITEAID